MAKIQEQRANPLSILTLAEPIITASNAAAPAPDNASPNKRISNTSASTDADENASPASLEADLSHYKELFSKLRLTYVEQSSKERFLRSLLSNPPLIVSGTENNALEQDLTRQKAVLQARKEEVRLLVESMGERGRELAARSRAVDRMRETVVTKPAVIMELEREVTELKGRSQAMDQGLGLAETKRVLGERQFETQEVERKIREMEGKVKRVGREAEKSERIVKDLGERRVGLVAEVRALREKGGVADKEGLGLEERGRWWRGVELSVKLMLEMEGDGEL